MVSPLRRFGISGFIGLSLLLLAAHLFVAIGSPPTSTATNQTSPAIQIANAARQSAEDEVQSEYWLEVATILNNDDPSKTSELALAAIRRNDRLQNAQLQRAARLRLIRELRESGYRPALSPFEFSTTINNSYFPYVPGRKLIYQSQTSEGLAVIERSMGYNTVTIDGVACRVLHDAEFLNGDVVEETADFVAERSDGTVWYFGEISRHFSDGLLDDMDGSWRAGKDGARPGIFMPANPVVGMVYRQEFLLNCAEDVGRVISTGVTVTVPAGTFYSCIEIESSSPIEPVERERKFYAPSIGLVREVNLSTGNVSELVQIVN